CWDGGSHFTFLNLDFDFSEELNWNFQEYGKLWNYNLQYANYLYQSDVSTEEKVGLMKSLYSWLSDGKLSLEPYPVSLRTINMIRWLSATTISNRDLYSCLYAELDFLSKRLEYHLLGNHL